MASAVDICNLGLSHLGARAQISAITPPDGSVEAGYCARFYPLARKELIEGASFAFTKKRAVLAELANDSDVWLYAYALPADCVAPLRVLNLSVLNLLTVSTWDAVPPTAEFVLSERGSSEFEIEGTTLRTNEPTATLLYKSDVTDTTQFPPLFSSALGMLMAGYLAGPIIKGLDGARVGAQWRDQAFMMVAKAAASDANKAHETNEYVPASIAVRA